MIYQYTTVGLEVCHRVLVVEDAHSFARVELVLEILPVGELDIDQVAHALGVDHLLFTRLVLALGFRVDGHLVVPVDPYVLEAQVTHDLVTY